MSESVSYLDVLRVYAFDTSKKLRLGVQMMAGMSLPRSAVAVVAAVTAIFLPVSAMKRVLRVTFLPVIPVCVHWIKQTVLLLTERLCPIPLRVY
jgi:hypothetical protein